MTWGQRLWLVLFGGGAVGIVVVSFGQFDARAHIGALVLASLATGAAVVLLGEVILRYSAPSRGTPIRTLLQMVAVLFAVAVPVSIAINSPVPVELVAVFAAMAVPIMIARR